MNEVSLDELRERALDLSSNKSQWHFHIMTPQCRFNESSQFAFVLENLDTSETFVNYSDRAEAELGQELAPLLHGKDIFDSKSSDPDYSPSPVVQEMLKAAAELDEDGNGWHHHMLFPGCRFNENSPKFTLVFESHTGDSLLESISDTEPTNDLKQIESIFYSRK